MLIASAGIAHSADTNDQTGFVPSVAAKYQVDDNKTDGRPPINVVMEATGNAASATQEACIERAEIIKDGLDSNIQRVDGKHLQTNIEFNFVCLPTFAMDKLKEHNARHPSHGIERFDLKDGDAKVVVRAAPVKRR